MATPAPQSGVSVLTYVNGDGSVVVGVKPEANGKTTIAVSGKGGKLTLEAYPHEPTITIQDPERGTLRLKACMSILANGQLRGFFVEKKGESPDKDTLAWFPARKQRRPKGRKKATASPVRHE